MGRVWAEGRHLRGKTAGVGAAENEDGVGRRGRLAGRNSRSNEAVSAMERGPLAGAAGATAAAGRLDAPPPLLRPARSRGAVPMRSPRLGCSSFFAGGVLVRCNSLRVLDEHCRLRLPAFLAWFCFLALVISCCFQVQRSARLLHVQLCAVVQGLLYSFFPTCLFFLATHMLLFL
ncbi:hypothetical protein VPH35_134684 [Triticum aestivum]